MEGVASRERNGVMAVAAERVVFGRAVRSSVRKERKFEESFGDFVLQPMPSAFGYSQLSYHINTQFV